MYYQRTTALLLATTMLCTMTGCGTPIKTGPAAQGVSTERTEYLDTLVHGASSSNEGLVDITEAVAFISTLNQVLPTTCRIENYTTTYDPESATVMVTSDHGTVALKLNEDGTVKFASANGDMVTKSRLNQAIAKTCVGVGLSDSVAQLFDKAEEIQWLNGLNQTMLSMDLDDIDVGELNIDAMQIQLPTADGTTDAEFSFNGGLETPVLTEHLEQAGMTDLSHYFESPSLDKFWPETDTEEVLDDIDGILGNGISLRDYYHSITIKPKEPVKLETLWEKKELDAGSLTVPTLPPTTNSDMDSDATAKAKAEAFLATVNEFTKKSSEWLDKEYDASADAKAPVSSSPSIDIPELDTPDFEAPDWVTTPPDWTTDSESSKQSSVSSGFSSSFGSSSSSGEGISKGPHSSSGAVTPGQHSSPSIPGGSTSIGASWPSNAKDSSKNTSTSTGTATTSSGAPISGQHSTASSAGVSGASTPSKSTTSKGSSTSSGTSSSLSGAPASGSFSPPSSSGISGISIGANKGPSISHDTNH